MGQQHYPPNFSYQRKQLLSMISVPATVTLILFGAVATVNGLTLWTALIFAAVLSVSLAVAFFLQRSLGAPFRRVREVTELVGQGISRFEVPKFREIEFKEIMEAFDTMSSRIRELIQENVEKVMLENELDIASSVQQNLIPPPMFQVDRLEVHSYYLAAARCGGDWWGNFKVGNKICIGIGDATGHGIQCALMTAAAKGSFSMLRKMAEEDPAFELTPSNVLRYANRAVFESAEGRIQMTFFVVVLDMETRELSYASAGHNPAWLFKRDGQTHKLQSLVSMGPRLGESLDVGAFAEHRATLDEGDVLMLYTDGLMENENPDGQAYGKRRMRATTEAAFAKGPQGMVDELIADFTRHNQGLILRDDVTLVAARLN